jgi:molecular chaperone DnaJ
LTKNPYEILGVDKTADQDVIKKAYRSLSKEHHPDKGGDEEKFKELSEAYSILSDPKKRAEYDNPMRNMGNPFEDMFGRFGGQAPNPNAPRQGRHIKMEREMPLHLFLFGGKFKVSFNFNDSCRDCDGKGATEFDRCDHCNGTGRVTVTMAGRGMHVYSSSPCSHCAGRGAAPKNQCETCSGKGTVSADREVILPIPKGFRDGQVAGAAGAGGSGINGGPPGDFLVKVYMKYPDIEKLTDEQRKVLEEL